MRNVLQILDLAVGICLFIQWLHLRASLRDELLDRELGVDGIQEPIGDLNIVPSWYVPSTPCERRDLPASEIHHRRRLVKRNRFRRRGRRSHGRRSR
jgi:hypothetical protein